MNPSAKNEISITAIKSGISLTLLFLSITVILWIWFSTSFDLLLSGASGALIALGRLAGFTAALSALLQFMLMGRIGWIEGGFGLDNIAKLHRKNGYVVIIAILIHIGLITFGYGLSSMEGPIAQNVIFFNTFPYVWQAMIAAVLFLAVVVTSIFMVKKHLKFERWYIVHLMVYAAIILAFSHQLAVGGSFAGNQAYSNIWRGFYIFVAINVIFYRFLTPLINAVRFGFRVDRVVKESDSVTSIYIRGNNLLRFNSKAGQFVLVRILAPKLGPQEHPFSLSQVTTDEHLRITVKNIGDYTAMLQDLKPGNKVIVSGPFGSFTRAKATSPKMLYLAGGIGITPFRAMIEEGNQSGDDAILIWSNKSAKDVIFQDDFKKFEATSKFKFFQFFSQEKNGKAAAGRLTADQIVNLVPDLKERSIYICGPMPFINSLESGLKNAGLRSEQLHSEKFSLTN